MAPDPGIYNFFGSNIVGVKALMRSADLSPEEGETEAPPSLTSGWKKSWEMRGFQKALVGFAVVLGLGNVRGPVLPASHGHWRLV